MDKLEFAVTWDYRCPFARNAHEHILDALEDGAQWKVKFVPFSLNQPHVAEGAPSVFESPEKAPDLLAMEAAIVVRDRFPAAFFRLHRGLFTARHDEGITLKERADVTQVLKAADVDPEAVWTEVDSGWPRRAFADAHMGSVESHKVFGVPTFIVGDQAVFVRLMTRPQGDGGLARQTIERVVDLTTGHPEINELKHTTVSR
ncbi:MAG: DsbA family protein [Acidimicrobiales bacterium]